ncbi:conjugal transfer protein TrbG [Sphingobium sp. SYK-6]|uniref:P-type conjugative transfer protein TrbG n=1 Tax=Sphingobium sp. (strain NBRC 103272 / SYK-6) TaxID=627192 RepID=UPI0002277718|nr:P-type conjugative transfer protein TrbG [Sphingobium sp. SYK-6]BAK67273.1 conjugal transfer protein TrbG [Sphingobium sp. SYK-6]
MKYAILATAVLAATAHAQATPPTTVEPQAAAARPPAAPTAIPPAPPVPVAATPPVQHRRARPSAAELRVRAANAQATQEPAAHAFINAVQIYPYSDGVLYRLFAAPEHVSDIALQPGETIVSIAAGDTARWTVGDTSSGTGDTKRAHILVKPFAAGLSTNLIITTDRRAYHLQMESTATTAMAALSWTYPQDELIAIRRQQAEAAAARPVASGLAVEQLNFSYAITGDNPAWRPLRAFDDGRQTFIEFPASLGTGEAPPLFLVDARGEASLVNYRVQGRFYVVDRLFDMAELRLGLRHQQIVRIARASDNGRRRRGS